jgi:hypothetical protein
MQVRYLAGCASSAHLRRVAAGIGLTAPQFVAGEGVVADEPPALSSVVEKVDGASVTVETAPVAASDSSRPLSEHVAPQRSTSVEPVETAERAAEHQKLIDEVLGHGQPARRRRWRRRAV